jgi:hypothetical protein
MTDSHAAAQLAFGRRVSFGRARSGLHALGGTLLGRAVSHRGGMPVKHRKKKHHKKPAFHHVRRKGVVIPDQMLQMLAFVAIVDKIRGTHA